MVVVTVCQCVVSQLSDKCGKLCGSETCVTKICSNYALKNRWRGSAKFLFIQLQQSQFMILLGVALQSYKFSSIGANYLISCASDGNTVADRWPTTLIMQTTTSEHATLYPSQLKVLFQLSTQSTRGTLYNRFSVALLKCLASTVWWVTQHPMEHGNHTVTLTQTVRISTCAWPLDNALTNTWSK